MQQCKYVFSAFLFIVGAQSTFAQAVVPPQVEQSRNFRTSPNIAPAGPQTAPQLDSDLQTGNAGDDSFGSQQILKHQEKWQPFSAFAAESAFFTNNVALARRGQRSDALMNSVFGLGYDRPLTPDLTLTFSLQGAVFRYDKYSQLDFESIDAGAGLSCHLRNLGDITVSLRYDFTDLISGENGNEILRNHALTLDAEKVFTLSRAQSVLAGASASVEWAAPTIAQRDEFGIYAGYQLQVSRSVDANASYRLGFFPYQGDRRDWNQVFSLGLRYRLCRWITVGCSAFAGLNSSNQSAFDYSVFNGGCNVTATIRF